MGGGGDVIVVTPTFLRFSCPRQGGLKGFFGKGGLKTQWARDIPYAMITLLIYETIQNAAARRREPGPKQKKGSALENMVIGAVAGGMGSLATNPMDMIKTRMMTTPERYTGPMDVVWTALRAEGPQVWHHTGIPRGDGCRERDQSRTGARSDR